MDLHQFTVSADDCGDTDLTCQKCPSWGLIASSTGSLGSTKQLPNPITLSALLAAATQHDAEQHPRSA